MRQEGHRVMGSERMLQGRYPVIYTDHKIAWTEMQIWIGGLDSRDKILYPGIRRKRQINFIDPRNGPMNTMELN